MCRRITRASPREAIAKEFGVTRFAEVDWHPRYNVAPSQFVETIISVNGEKRRGPMRWGAQRGERNVHTGLFATRNVHFGS
jgi:putative SOS response-associated peptidase YedK